MGVKAGVDPQNLAQAGWGVIFPAYLEAEAEQRKQVDAIREALQPLLRLRASRAGARYREYHGADGFRVGVDSASTFLARNGAGPGPVNPDVVPYYLLLVGDPESIPSSVQSQLDVQYAVGRIHFDTPQKYADYAANVLNAETAHRTLDKLAVFAAVHPDDPYSHQAASLLTQPLLKAIAARFPQWAQQQLVGESATKAGLIELLRSPAPPAVLLCAGHGVGFNPDDPRQAAHQGALLCADWPGPVEWQQPIPPDFYFSADDLSDDMDLGGTVALLLASYSAGTPASSSHRTPADPTTRAARPFLAQLPARMLGRPRGALAAVGLTDRAWSYAFNWTDANADTAVLEAVMGRLLSGHPLGLALEFFSERYADLSATLVATLEDIKFGKSVDPGELARLWTAKNDAQNLTLLGDPAVRVTSGSTR